MRASHRSTSAAHFEEKDPHVFGTPLTALPLTTTPILPHPSAPKPALSAESRTRRRTPRLAATRVGPAVALALSAVTAPAQPAAFPLVVGARACVPALDHCAPCAPRRRGAGDAVWADALARRPGGDGVPRRGCERAVRAVQRE